MNGYVLVSAAPTPLPWRDMIRVATVFWNPLMAATAFDTLKYANTLKAAGVPDKQAEAQASVLGEALAVNFKDLATKDDLAALRIELQNDIRQTEQRLDAKIDQTEQRLNSKIDNL